MAEQSSSIEISSQDVLRLSADIVSAYVTNNSIKPDGLPDLLHAVHQSLTNLGDDISPAPAPLPEKRKPAVPVSRSVHEDHLICLEDGKKLTMLKRYLRSRYDLSPEEYRRKWNLPSGYPIVAPAYATRRSEFAKSIGLGKGVRRSKT